MKYLVGFVLGCVVSMNAMALVFEAQLGYERSAMNMNQGTTTFPDTPLDGGYYQFGAGFMLNMTPLVQVPIMVEASSGQVRYDQMSESLRNIGKVKGSIGLVTKPALRIGDGRLYVIIGGSYVPFESKVLGYGKKKNTYFMPNYGFGMSYLIFPDVHIFSESRMYGTDTQPIKVASSSNSTDNAASRYDKFTSSIGVMMTIL